MKLINSEAAYDFPKTPTWFGVSIVLRGTMNLWLAKSKVEMVLYSSFF